MARTTTAKKKGKRERFSFFSGMTPENKSAFYRYCGLAVAVFALFTLASLASYLFTWKADQSLLAHPDMIEKGVDVSNWGGKLGYRWSEFLLARCFGLGSFALVFLMGVRFGKSWLLPPLSHWRISEGYYLRSYYVRLIFQFTTPFEDERARCQSAHCCCHLNPLHDGGSGHTVG